jgi:hypothetical protein
MSTEVKTRLFGTGITIMDTSITLNFTYLLYYVAPFHRLVNQYLVNISGSVPPHACPSRTKCLSTQRTSASSGLKMPPDAGGGT